MRKVLVLLVIAVAGVSAASGQVASGGAYGVTQQVIGGGGGTSSGGSYGVDGTPGQPTAGSSNSGGSYGSVSGFWQPSLGPTAAGATLAGRVVDAAGKPLGGFRVTAFGGRLIEPVSTTTTGAGYFTFAELESGQVYIVTVKGRRYTFSQPTQIVSLLDNVTDIVFQANW